MIPDDVNHASRVFIDDHYVRLNHLDKLDDNFSFLINHQKINHYIECFVDKPKFDFSWGISNSPGDYFSSWHSGHKPSEYRFVKEKIHKTLFQKLFVIYSIKEFKKSRLKRFVRRIKINKLSSLIKNKKIVDFGCGHGNFLMSLNKFNPKKRVGIDYGISSIKMAKRLKTKLFPNSKISFLLGSVYKTKLKSKYFDFAIQNGVFHHLNYELKAYKEVHRVLKKNGYFWIYTDGGGGIRDFIFDMSQEILSKIDEDFVQRQISSIGLNIGKQYHLGDTLRAKYSHTDLPTIKKQLNKIGFKFVRQLRGGYKTDFDYPFSKDKNFKEKFGSGDLRLLFRKK